MAKRFVRVFLILFIASLSYFPMSRSQQRMGRSVADRVKDLKEQLSLDSAQVDSIQKIYTAADKQRSDLFEANKDDRGAMRDAMTKLNAETDAQVEKLLTDAQKKKYEDMMKARQNRRGTRGGRGGRNMGNEQQPPPEQN